MRRRGHVGVAHAEVDHVGALGPPPRLQPVDLLEDGGRQAACPVEVGAVRRGRDGRQRGGKSDRLAHRRTRRRMRAGTMAGAGPKAAAARASRAAVSWAMRVFMLGLSLLVVRWDGGSAAGSRERKACLPAAGAAGAKTAPLWRGTSVVGAVPSAPVKARAQATAATSASFH